MREQDVLYRFLIENADVRGVLVRLDDTWREVQNRANYSPAVKRLLGQAMVATVAMSANLKFSGKLTFQVRGEGPVNLLVVQVDDQRHVRGMALARSDPPEQPLTDIFGQSQMSISITGATPGMEYRGVVELRGNNLAEALAGYFRQSEQLDTRMWMQVSDATASGLMLQKLPQNQTDSDDWNRLVQLTQTVTDHELAAVPVKELLYRFYHEDKVRLFEPDAVAFQCTCSRDRVMAMVKGLGHEEAKSILEEQGQIEVTCEFCNQRYAFDAVDVGALFSTSVSDSSVSPTQH